MKLGHSLSAALALFLSACAAAPAAIPAASVSAAAPKRDGVHAAWWADQRWRYGSDAEAETAYARLLDRQSPWPEWHQPNVVTLPVGTRFQMALSPGQGTDRPGGFGTFDRVPDVAYVRRALAVKSQWKSTIDRIVTYEVATPLPADTGTVGPQIDREASRYLPGGGSQLEMKVPPAERIAHLRVVEVRPLRQDR
jgi:hypothetical protein